MNCPYDHLPETSWWKHAVAGKPVTEINPHLAPLRQITPQTRVASAGSCFAQNISRALVARGYNYLVIEKAPSALPPQLGESYGYGIFSARYGNIYTPLQLLQLIERAFGDFRPVDQFWEDGDGRCYDLLRPRIVPKGFSSRAEAETELDRHLAAVRKLFHDADVLIFTLGLTEAWLHHTDGTVYPTCPGCGSAGTFDPDRYYFHNFNAAETADHLRRAVARLKTINPRLRIILTVSPVPLAATMTSRHVLQATTYSKSVLRVVAEEITCEFDNVHYFGSYELILGTFQNAEFFTEDRRSVSAAGVALAMQRFFEQFDAAAAEPQNLADSSAQLPADASSSQHGVICDEDDFFRAVARNRQPCLSPVLK